MANYLLLYSGGSMPETQDEQAAVLKGWEAWFGQLGEALVDAGNPFSPQAKSISSDGMVSDGPVGEMASGYSVIMADTLDDAVEMSKGCPVLKGGAQVSVYETFDAMGM
jgi:hypothetical protein